ncbi:hypothetical protein AGRO_2972 [Agrobacterium sp. ATCC 31749]|nr:hypothetical protein AGRO_2972 [Agrobacterium sp. ATCC 31749]
MITEHEARSNSAPPLPSMRVTSTHLAERSSSSGKVRHFI